jgi:CspA family cold shock protein
MTYGTVTSFDPHRGVGTIALEHNGQQVAVHAGEIDGGGKQSLRVRDRVAFTLLDGPDGPRATRVWTP